MLMEPPPRPPLNAEYSHASPSTTMPTVCQLISSNGPFGGGTYLPFTYVPPPAAALEGGAGLGAGARCAAYTRHGAPLECKSESLPMLLQHAVDAVLLAVRSADALGVRSTLGGDAGVACAH